MFSRGASILEGMQSNCQEDVHCPQGYVFVCESNAYRFVFGTVFYWNSLRDVLVLHPGSDWNNRWVNYIL